MNIMNGLGTIVNYLGFLTLIAILIFGGLALLCVILYPLASWLTHLEMTKDFRQKNSTFMNLKITLKDLKALKKIFDTRVWVIDKKFKGSFFSPVDNLKYRENYIHAGVITIHNISYTFSFLGYLGFCLWSRTQWKVYCKIGLFEKTTT